jgi:S1-C subfamily serine protease
MNYRRLHLLVWLIAPALVATFVIGSYAGPAARPDRLPAFQIVSPGVSEVFTQDVTPGVAQSLHMRQAAGALVSDVLPSPLRHGDVILSINGHPVGCSGQLDAELAQVGFGQQFTLEILRDGRTQTVTLQRAMEAASVLHDTVDIRGIQVASLSTQNGVIVTDTKIGTAASDGGLKSGDIILQVDGHVVHSAAEFQKFMRQLNNLDATFDVRQRDGELSVFVIPSQP